MVHLMEYSPVLPEVKSHTLRVIENIDGTLGIEDTTIATSRASGVFSSDRGKIDHLRCVHVLTSNSGAEAQH
jgi:hypothetical protein